MPLTYLPFYRFACMAAIAFVRGSKCPLTSSGVRKSCHRIVARSFRTGNRILKDAAKVEEAPIGIPYSRYIRSIYNQYVNEQL